MTLTDRQRGFTIVELMVSVAVLAVLGAVAHGLAGTMEQERRTTLGYQDDLRECRRVLSDIERDVRAAHGARTTGDRLSLHTASGPIDYRVEGTELRRIADGSHPQVIARCIERIETRVDGRLVRVTLQLRPRTAAKTDGQRAARIATSVAMRNPEGDR